MTKPIDHFDKLVLLCGNDRAVGEHGENHSDIRQKRPLGVESESLGTTEEVTLESIHETNNDHEVTSPEVQIVQEPRAKRSRKSRDDAEIEGIKSALANIADAFRESTAVHEKAFRESTAAYEKIHQKLPISEEDVWKLLEELQVDNHLLTRTYVYLLENPDKLRALLGCPKNRQKNFLTEIMFNSSR